MHNIEVLAVEIKQFRGKQTQTLVPRVLGRTASSSTHGSTGSRPITRRSFLDDFTSDETRKAATRLLDVAQESSATFEWGMRGGVSIRGRCSRWQQPITVAWLYTPLMEGRGWMRTKDFTFGVGILDNDPAAEEELRGVLQRWVDGFRDDPFTTGASSRGVVAWSVDYDAAARHIDLLAGRLAWVLRELNSL